MNVKRPLSALRVLAAAVAAASACLAQQTRPGPLETKLLNVPEDIDNVPLQSALYNIGARTKELFLFGAELPLDHGDQPLIISVHIPGGVTVREALSLVFANLPGNTFVSVAPHLINILPDRYRADSDDMLNVPVTNLQLVDVAPYNILFYPARYIPALHEALHIKPVGLTIGPGPIDPVPGITIAAQNTTVLGVLNLASLESITVAERHLGLAWGWLYLRERYPSDSHPAHQWVGYGGWAQGKHRDW